MPTQFKGRTFLAEWEAHSRLGFSPRDVPQLRFARVFAYRGMAELNPGIPTKAPSCPEGMTESVFVEGFFFSDMAEHRWQEFAPRSFTSEGVTYGSIEHVATALPCCAVVDGALIEDKVYSDAEFRYHFVSIHHLINGPVYYPEDLVVAAMATLGISPENAATVSSTQATTDAADMDPRERTTLLRIIKTLALAQGLTLDVPHSAADQVAALAAQYKVRKLPALKTIAAKLTDARDIE